MNTTILFFGSLTDLFGRERVVDLPPDGVSLGALRRLVASGPAETAALEKPGIRAAVDQRVAGDEEMVRPRQEVAFFSPVSGG